MRQVSPLFAMIGIFSFSITCWSQEGLGHTADLSTNQSDEYRSEVDAWRESHESKLRSPTSWLALIDHVWLVEGDNTFGSEDGVMIALPEGIRKEARGTIQVNAGFVRLRASSEAKILVDGMQVEDCVLKIDPVLAEADCQSRISIDERISMQLVRRNGRLAMRVRDASSPRIRDFRGNQWYPPIPEYRLEGRYVKYDEPQSKEIENIRGDRLESRFTGYIEFNLRGQNLRWDAQEEGDGELFIVFRDQTAGRTTYPSGRFLTLQLRKSENESIVIDFNKAYNPPCAFSPFTLCPLPTKANVLNQSIEAGERYDVHSTK